MASTSCSRIIVFLVPAILLLLYIRFQAAHQHLTNTMHRIDRTAPLHLCDLPAEEIIPDSYAVSLWPGTTLAQHKAALPDVDLDRAIKHVIPPKLPGSGILYSATLKDGELDAVRGDATHVQLVECNRRVHLSTMDDL